jgi:deoxyribodipyrimidine photo-lyase
MTTAARDAPGGTVPATLVWFRQDLRLADNPALSAALARGGPVVPVYIDSESEEGDWPAGAASLWWRHHSLASLEASLQAAGSRLVLRRGPALATLRELARECGADAIYWNRRYEPAVRERDARIKEALRADGFVAESRNGALLAEPWELRTQGGGPFQVFTPYWRKLLATIEPPRLLPAPAQLVAPAAWPASLPLATLGYLPRIPWDAGLHAHWQPGEAGATRQLEQFISSAIPRYADRRDLPAEPGTSRLSPCLHHGELSPRQVWHVVLAADPQARAGKYLAELVWREFSYHLLHHFPHTPGQPLRPAYAAFPWREDAALLRAWQRGQTGIPLVDAGMRELWHTGWMHNRVRMVTASFLVKNLLQPWQAGARWFWDTLVDADLAANTQGWQWTAGCGADAAPFFRIFNPVTQGERFDPKGEYLRRWLPELARLEGPALHTPWEATPVELAAAGVVLGKDYPLPIVSLADSRQAALAALKQMQGKQA